MKPRKDKKYNTYLRNLESQQQTRIEECGNNAYQCHRMIALRGVYITYGTIYTDRDYRCSNSFKMDETYSIKGEQMICGI